MRCKDCQYSLEKLTPVEGAHRCPECGRGFDPTQSHTFDATQPITRRQTLTVVVTLVLVAYVAALAPLLCIFAVRSFDTQSPSLWWVLKNAVLYAMLLLPCTFPVVWLVMVLVIAPAIADLQAFVARRRNRRGPARHGDVPAR